MLRRRSTDTEVRGARSAITESNEAHLINLVVERDLDAFETLYRNYFPRLTRFLDRMTRSVDLIEEIVNDTMLVVWQKAHTFNHGSKVSTWIFAIAYRKALKAIRFLDEALESDFEQYPSDAAHEPEQEITHQQRQKIVVRALDALPAEQRAVVNLTYYHGMGYGEIAEIMGCPVNTVETRMFHARRRLKTLLSGRMEDM